ncbi:site-specific integrase [Paraliobacillus sp. X-1268]|uniref:site-specific integrase n=1 Tax=Paraliobacillus sp. X-1268 TaxID=2213193 RepID=UPI000E3EB61F|nr:site-specific integrase [Paraliobacillus sp. X-1268]
MATFREMPSGKWQARVYRNGKYESIGTFSTKKEAEVKSGEIERQIYFNETPTDRHVLFQVVIDDWFKLKTQTVKSTTLDQLEVVKRIHIEPFFAQRKLFQITRTDINTWIKFYEDMKDNQGNAKYSHGARQRYLSTLKDIFNHAVFEMEILNKNPSAKIQVPSRGKVAIKKDIKYYNLTELNILLEFLNNYEPPRFKDYKIYFILVYFLSRTGLRISEALALKWSDIEGNRININKQTSRNDQNQLEITTLKTVSSYRNIEIDDDTTEILMGFRKLQNDLILEHKGFKRNKDMILFQTYNGNYLTPSSIRETLQDYCFRAGVEYKGTHSFRHTHAVMALEAGADLLYISRRLGHGSISTTETNYLSVTEQYESGELNKIANHLNYNMAQTWHKGKTQK